MADLDDLQRDLYARVSRAKAALIGLSQVYAGTALTNMRRDGPWIDRSANARNRLFSQALYEPGASEQQYTIGIVAGHGMQYGGYLELGTRNFGIPPKVTPPGNPSMVASTGLVGYPVVAPTLAALQPRFLADARRLLQQAMG